MKRKLGINGFGRIGRLTLRAALENKNVEVVAVNDVAPIENLAYLLQYDSTHGNLANQVAVKGNKLVINGKEILVLCERDPEKLPWKSLGVDYVVESTGLFRFSDDAKKHLKAGAKRVLISAPGKDEVPTFVMGVNHRMYNPKTDFIVSNASCTTNCLAPITKVLLDNFGIEEGLMTTIHALTSSQPVVDAPSKRDYRIGRSGLQNIIPSSTGAAKAVASCLPEVKGKLTGMAFRIPVSDVSVVDLTVKLSKSTTYEEICKAMELASKTEMKGILWYCCEDLVSSDFIGNPHSSIFDKKAGIALNDRFYKLIAWYDNEIGYSHRIIDMLKYMDTVED